MAQSFKTPDYYRTVMPYLILKDVNRFIDFVEQVFQCETRMKHSDDNGRIQHAEVTFGDSTLMMGESSEQWKVQNAGLYINVEDADTAFQKALEAGGSVVMELSDQPYGRTCGVLDPCGNTWWITSPL